MKNELINSNIMVIDDTPANLKLLEEMLREHDFRVRAFPRGRLALQAAQKEPPDLILLDINMPEMDGYEVCRYLKEDERTREIPVIFISALNEADDKVKAFSSGGVDYVTKPFQFEEVQSRVETHLSLSRLLKQQKDHINTLERLAGVGQKTGLLIHDIKNAFNPITSAVHHGKINTDDEGLKNDFVKIENSVQKIIQMTQEICDISLGNVSMNLQITNLSEYLDQFIIDYGYNTVTMSSIFQLEIQYEYTGLISIDINRMSRVLQNLMNNAVDILSKSDEEEIIKILTKENEDYIWIEVYDSGPGVSESIVNTLFDFGVTANKVGTGTGMGLFYVQQIAEAHGGFVEYKRENDWSIFSIHIPKNK